MLTLEKPDTQKINTVAAAWGVEPKQITATFYYSWWYRYETEDARYRFSFDEAQLVFITGLSNDVFIFVDWLGKPELGGYQWDYQQPHDWFSVAWFLFLLGYPIEEIECEANIVLSATERLEAMLTYRARLDRNARCKGEN